MTLILAGAATGIGKAVCELFAKEGAIVVGVGLQNNTIDDVIKDLPNINGSLEHSSYSCDVSSEDNVKSLIENVYHVSIEDGVKVTYTITYKTCINNKTMHNVVLIWSLFMKTKLEIIFYK